MIYFTAIKRWLMMIVSIGFCFSLVGCNNLSYYAQATKGQWEMVAKRQSVQTLIDDPGQPEKLVNALTKVAAIRDFASSELALPDNKTFRYYSDLGRPYAVWNVIATPAFSLSPKTWCFPIAGCVAYKGYFSKANAQALNHELVDQSYDTFLYGVSAYSTLGWFSDPILNTFVHYDELSLAGLIFHELAHQVVYVKDDSAFNEAFATALQIEGLKRWVKATQDETVFEAYMERRTKNQRITEMVLSFRDKLSRLYQGFESRKAAGETLDTQTMQQAKRALFESMKNQYQSMKQEGQGTRYYDWWFELPLNNAHLIAVATYYRLVPEFSRMIAQSKDISAFFHRVEELAKLDKPTRDRSLGLQ